MVQITPNTPVTLRFRFRKVGSLQYVSHLDLVRTFSKTVIRTGLPLWFTEGFNPKPKLVFSPPLSIGVESECEYLDLRLTERVEPQLALDAMNRNVTDEMRFFDAYYPDCKLSDIAFLAYDIEIKTANADAHLLTKCLETLQAPEVPVEKKGKDDKWKTVNIRPAIQSLTGARTLETLKFHAVLASDSTTFLNPDVLVRVLREKCGILSSPDLLSEWVKIRRTAAFRADMSPFR